MGKRLINKEFYSSLKTVLSYQNFKPVRSYSPSELLMLKIAISALAAIAKKAVGIVLELIS